MTSGGNCMTNPPRLEDNCFSTGLLHSVGTVTNEEGQTARLQERGQTDKIIL